MEVQNKLIKSGFGVRKTYQGQKGFDKDYITREVHQIVKRTGEGEEDWILVNKVIEKKTPIKKVIEADACNAGIRAYLDPFIKTNTPLPDVDVENTIQDFSKMPESLAEAIKLGDDAKAAFEKLDPKLKGDAKTPEEFLKNITKEKFASYLASFVKKPVKKEEVNKNEEN